MTTENVETTGTGAAVAEQGATVGPEKASSKNTASTKKGAPKSQKGAKNGKPKATATAKPKKTAPARKAAKELKKAAKPKAEGVREGSKTAAVVALLERKGGASLADHEGYVVAGAQRARFHQRNPREEDGPHR